MIEKYGYWQVEEQKFLNKVDALHFATTTKSKIKFVYHDNVWKTFDRSLLGKVSLSTLYKERALQLRDKYKHIKLYYSGGSDSHNILMTFINNEIPLDEIIVRWPKPLIEGKFYKANTADKTARNYWSEWDFAVKPTLDWLKSAHPKIKITIIDYTEDITSENVEKALSTFNHTRGGILQGMPKYTPFEKQDCCHLFGVDKPMIYYENGNIYMFFSDIATTAVITNCYGEEYLDNKEMFYWSPDFPILAFEMAYQVGQHFLNNPQKLPYLYGYAIKSKDLKFSKAFLLNYQSGITKNICYAETWDNRFQADKPESGLRRDKFFWFFTATEFSEAKNTFVKTVVDLTSGLDSSLLVYEKTTKGIMSSVKPCYSDLYYVY